ncbi:hypothetical protein ILUMI_17798, partial [Ignelater luminosus]
CGDEIKNVMGDDCPHQTTVSCWYREFRREDFSTKDKPRSGRPSDVVTPDVINTVSNLIIEETLAISAPSVHKILHEHLKVRKVYTLWVFHALTVEQMACRVVCCKKMLLDYANGAPRYLNNFATGDETWLYYYDVRSKRKNQEWLFENEETPTERTVTASWYVNECLTEVFEQLKKLRPHSRMDTWHFHHDNARPHAARLTPDLAPCDFGLFSLAKGKLKGRKFRTDKELLAPWDQACAELPESNW